MLIACDRHGDRDLAIWRELEAADVIWGPRVESVRVSKSLRAFEEFADAGPLYVGTSWGKDSVVVAHLAWRTDPTIPLINLRVEASRNPHCDEVRDEFLSKFPMRYTEVDVDYASVDRCLPLHLYDRETDRLWYAAIKRATETMGTVRHALGIRAQESTGRRIRMLRWGPNSPNGCAPIGWWSDADVFAYLAHHDLPIHPNYAMLGGGRWPRDRLRVAEIGDSHGCGGGRREWETEYYPEILRRLDRRSWLMNEQESR